MVHGYPGDNLDAVIYIDDIIISQFGEGMDYVNEFDKWYENITNDQQKWPPFFVK